MSRELRPPLSGIRSSLPADWDTATEQELAVVRDGLLELFLEDNYTPVARETGPRAGVLRDPNWRKDIAQFVTRAAAHEITSFDPIANLYVVTNVSVKIDTLRPEVDDYGQICAWVYEES